MILQDSAEDVNAISALSYIIPDKSIVICGTILSVQTAIRFVDISQET